LRQRHKKYLCHCGCETTRICSEAHRQHGMSRKRIYRKWCSMLARCKNPNRKDYKQYGGSGIRVCQRWHDFTKFYEDMGDPPSQRHSLDRIDGNGPYSPENCRWATFETQNRNRRTTPLISWRGEGKPLVEWCEITGLKKTTLHRRLNVYGWDVERAMTEAPRPISSPSRLPCTAGRPRR
jgi:hypothetical protein